jgi:DNA-binding response OmpR family regulator
MVLGVDSQEWTLRSVESVLAPRGFAFVRAYSAAQGLELLDHVRPDLVLCSSRPGELPIAEFLQHLRQRTVGGHVLPIAVLLSGQAARGEQVALLEAGALVVIAPPVDPDILVAQVSALVKARRDAERGIPDQLVDPETGLYAAPGLQRRAQEVAAEAYRLNRTVTCAVVHVGDADRDANGVVSEARAVAQSLQRTLRQSDLVARVGPLQFAVLGTTDGPDGVAPFLGRLEEATRTALGGADGRRLALGAATAPGYRDRFIPVDDLLARAMAEVRTVPAMSRA